MKQRLTLNVKIETSPNGQRWISITDGQTEMKIVLHNEADEQDIDRALHCLSNILMRSMMRW